VASVLGDNLLDDLLPVVDDLRGDLLPQFGIRQYTVKIVRKIWDGPERGDGNFRLEKLELSPQPMVDMRNYSADGLRYGLIPQGRTDEGLIKVTELSLAAYQEDDLTGGKLPANVELYWEITDAQGQGVEPRFFVPAGPPIADREKTLGWVVFLKRAEEE